MICTKSSIIDANRYVRSTYMHFKWKFVVELNTRTHTLLTGIVYTETNGSVGIFSKNLLDVF